ncbi:AAA family ATPase [Rhizobium leguminosarum]|nr:AAA family ATPase [Rhizobium ruizarguesonis]TCA14939.1 hypothetical protein E0H70_35960 [Rhizobium leguminosarum bv. viciae]
MTVALGADYWKPIQSGLYEEADCKTVLRLSGISSERILPEAYRLSTPASPHLSAQLDGVVIDTAQLVLPARDAPLVVEGLSLFRCR